MAYLLVPIATVRTALRIDAGESDELLAIYVSAASRGVQRYLKGQFSEAIIPGVDSPAQDSPPNSPPDDITAIDDAVQFAVIALTGIMYREPDGDAAKNFAETGQLPYIVTALLYPLRDPALA